MFGGNKEFKKLIEESEKYSKPLEEREANQQKDLEVVSQQFVFKSKDKLPQFSDNNREKYEKISKIVLGWTPTIEVWPIRYGPQILCVASALSSLYVTNYYRTVLRMGDLVRLTMYSTSMYFPSLMAGVSNHSFVLNPIITKPQTCPICTQLKSSLLQAVAGSIYPLILSSMTGIYFAFRYSTYAFPDNLVTEREGLKVATKTWWKLTNRRGGIRVFAGLFAANALLGYFVAKEQQLNYFYVVDNFRQQEEQKRNDREQSKL